MTVRETLELDLRGSLASLQQLDRQLVGTARQFSTELNRGIGDLNKSIGCLGTGAGLGPLQQEIDETTQKQKENEEQTQRNAASLSRLGTTAGIAGAAIAAGIGLAIKASLDFERSLSTVGAVSDATAGQLTRLREAAIQAGAATVFSAKDAADAEAELAKAGLSVKEILGGALTGALNLAAAGQLELADAATIAAQAMQIFNLQGGDVSHIADVLAAGANKSTASVSSLGEGLGNVGGAARLAGLGLEETVGVLALLDQNAVRGAEGGTALRSMLVALFGPTDKAKNEMQRLGISVYNAQGQFIGLEGVAGQLQTAFKGVDDATRNASLSLIFGTFGLQAANTLYREGADGVAKYTKAVNDNGAAQRFASAQLDNLAGDLEQLKGSLETALIKTGGNATAALRGIAQSATGVVNAFAETPGPIQAAGGALATVTAVTLLGFSAFVKLKPAIDQARTSFDNLSPGAQAAATNLGRVAAITTGLVIGATSLSAIGDSAESTAVGLLGMAAAGAAVGSAIPGVGTAAGAAIGLIAGMGAAALKSGEQLHGFEIAVADVASSTNRELERMAQQMIFVARAVGAIEKPSDLASRALKQIADTSKESIDSGIRLGRAFADAGIITEQQLAKALEKASLRARVFAKDVLDGKDAAEEFAGGVAASAEAAEKAAQAFDDYIKALSAGVPSVSGAFDSAAQAAEEFARKNEEAFSPDKLLENLTKQLDAIRQFPIIVQQLLDRGFDDIAAEVLRRGPETGALYGQAILDAKPETAAAVEGTIDALKFEYAKLPPWISGTLAPQLRNTSYGAGLGSGEGLGQGVVASAPQATGAAEYLIGLVNNTMGQLSGEMQTIGYNAVNGLVLGIQLGYPEIYAASLEMGRLMAEATGAALSVTSPSKVMMRIGHYAAEGLALGMDQGGGLVARASQRMALRALPGAAVGAMTNSTAIDRSVNAQITNHNYGQSGDAVGRGTVSRLRLLQLTG